MTIEHPAGGGHARGKRVVGDRLHQLAGQRALDGQHRVVLEAVDDVDVEGCGVGAQPGEVLGVPRGVGDGQEAVGLEPIGEQVVEDPTVLAAQQAVLGPAHRHALHVVGEHPLQEGRRLGSRGLDLSHVGDVEDPRPAAHGEVLG